MANSENKETNKNNNKVIFSEPYNFEGEEYTEIELDLNKLTGTDLIAAETEVRMLGDQTITLEYSRLYLASVASKAIKKPIEFITKLPAKDFTEVTLRVQDFLLR